MSKDLILNNGYEAETELVSLGIGILKTIDFFVNYDERKEAKRKEKIRRDSLTSFERFEEDRKAINAATCPSYRW